MDNFLIPTERNPNRRRRPIEGTGHFLVGTRGHINKDMGLIEWVQGHLVELAAVYGMTVALVSAIVKLTPTLKDDSIWLPIVKFLGKYIALNRGINDDEIRK